MIGWGRGIVYYQVAAFNRWFLPILCIITHLPTDCDVFFSSFLGVDAVSWYLAKYLRWVGG